MKSSNPDFLNGVPELVILQILDGEPMYGYELVQRIRLNSGEQLCFGEGCVYPTLHRLESEGYLTSKRQNVGGRNRVVYRLTRQGKARLVDVAAEWKRVVAAVGGILHGGNDGLSGTAESPA
jgi:PadR family transcriptional regulator PadR